MVPYRGRMPALLRQEAVDRSLSGDMTQDELRSASELALREYPIDQRINPSGGGDDHPTVLELLKSDLL